MEKTLVPALSPPARRAPAAAADSPAKNGLWRGMRVSLARVRETAGRYKSCWRAVWAVEMLVAALVIPLQFASALLVTLPLTLPIMLELQAASPAALFERRGTWGALMRSRQLIRRVRWPLALPFLAGIVLQRLSLLGRDHVLGLLPPRLFVDVVEIPIIIFVGGAVLSILLLRCVAKGWGLGNEVLLSTLMLVLVSERNLFIASRLRTCASVQVPGRVALCGVCGEHSERAGGSGGGCWRCATMIFERFTRIIHPPKTVSVSLISLLPDLDVVLTQNTDEPHVPS